MVNFIFAVWVAVIPLVFSVTDLIGMPLEIPVQCFFIAGLYILYLLIKFAFNFDFSRFCKWIKEKLTRKSTYLFILFLLFILVSTIINGDKGFSLFYFSFFIIFCILFNLNENQTKKFIELLIITVAITCIMGLIDPQATFMPGFYKSNDEISYISLSNQYYNPNYAGYVVAMCMTMLVFKLKDASNWKNYVKYGLIFVIYSIYLYMNGSFVPISAVYLILFVLIIFYWIQEKKFPLKLLYILLLFAAFAFIVDAMPNVNLYRTCGYNYFLELIAAFDNIFGTNLLSLFNIETIAGADGWDRDELLSSAISSINPLINGNSANGYSSNSNIMNFFFGAGAGAFIWFMPHNNFICVLLDYGIFVLILYVAILIYYFIRFFKSEKNTLQTMLAAVVFIMSMMGFFGTIMVFWYWLFISVLGAGFKSTSKITKEVKQENKDV